jgi:Capsular polysaccharide synthesis protein/Polysaccharide pyruvyl transferase
MASWECKNPDWAFRCLDATSIERYVQIRDYLDLGSQIIPAASLADIVRILLLHEFGGVWVDATLFCNGPLDDWLPEVMSEGFFAFANPAPDRPLSSWFLSAAFDSPIVAAWVRDVLAYWEGRKATHDYFWFHHLFSKLCEANGEVARSWSRVPKVSAIPPHSVQNYARAGYSYADAAGLIDWTQPVFKLDRRLSDEVLKPGTLIEHLLSPYPDDPTTPQATSLAAAEPPPRRFAALKVSTENLGDHFQVIAGLQMLARIGIEPSLFVDRDDEIRSAPMLDDAEGSVGILLNGWFKTNRAEWPPHSKLAPLIYGFHIRLHQCPELVSDESIAFFRRYQPIGCRDVYTETLLRQKGVEVTLSNCLSLTFPRRIEMPEQQRGVFVVSRDARIKDYLPDIGPYTFISHYSGSTDFAANMALAEELLETYRKRAKLIVTTLLHCALPAIAMGIPVVVFYPLGDAAGHASDRERFSSLAELIKINRLDDIGSVDWNPKALNVSMIKLQILDGFYRLTARWQVVPRPLGPIAPPDALPVPA